MVWLCQETVIYKNTKYWKVKEKNTMCNHLTVKLIECQIKNIYNPGSISFSYMRTCANTKFIDYQKKHCILRQDLKTRLQEVLIEVVGTSLFLMILPAYQ
jgi:hypothetical protein